MRFLHAGDSEPVADAERALELLREHLRSANPRSEATIDAAAAASAQLRRVMVRTERLSSTANRDGMLTELPALTPVVQEDITGFLAAQKLADELHSPNVVELWKTAPWIANIGDGYRMTETLIAQPSDFAWSDPSLLDIDVISQFGPLPVPSPRLRWLRDKTVGQGWHRLLWLPPCRPYYATDNEFDAAAAEGITKQLVFSSWRIAPKAIAIGLTYAARAGPPSSVG